MSCQYRVLARDDQIGRTLRFTDHPNLELYYQGYENHLCPSNYSDARCFWAGYLEVTFEIDGQAFTIRNDQTTPVTIELDHDTYQIIGCDFLVENRSREATWLYFNLVQL